MEDLSFSPTCISYAHDYLAVGGQRSQIMIKSVTTNYVAQSTVGGSINNAIAMTKQPNGIVKMFICNNDESIKVFTLPELNRVATLQLPTAANYCSISPDGRKLVAVGDSNQVFLYDIYNDAYSKIATMTTVADAGFSCAWNQSSEKFAVSTQDGYVCVWDVRSTEKLTKLQSVQVCLTILIIYSLICRADK